MSRNREQDTTRSRTRPIAWQTGALFAVLSAFGLFLLALALTGHVWRAVAYGVVALFAFLVLLAAYFWGAMLFGGTLEMLRHRRTATPWDFESGQNLAVPQHDIDPGLELLAAGVLVYRVGEVKPHPYFRRVPLANVRAIRPFMVARTGAERSYKFTFLLNNEIDVNRFGADFEFPVRDDPQVVMPPYRLLVENPRALVGQRWTLRVRSGVTIVTTVRFLFVDADAQTTGADQQSGGDSRSAEWQTAVLPRLLDEAVKYDAMAQTQEIELEVV